MTKTELKNYLGGNVVSMAARLGYKDRQSIYRLPEILTPRMAAAITMRMRANGIKVLAGWE